MTSKFYLISVIFLVYILSEFKRTATLQKMCQQIYVNENGWVGVKEKCNVVMEMKALASLPRLLRRLVLEIALYLIIAVS